MEFRKALKLPEVRERLASLGIEPVGSSPAEFEAHIRTETDKWTKVVRDADIKPE